MKDSRAKQGAYLELHIAVFLFGFTAILGDLITLPQFSLVWYRMMITTFSLLLFPGIIVAVRRISAPTLLRLVLIGVIVSIHWVTFFGAIKLSNVSVALSCMATTAFFTSLLEPFFFNTKIKFYELILGAVIIAGIYIIYSFTELYLAGMLMGLSSAFLAALFSIFNKRMIARHEALPITFVELGSGWLFLTLLIPIVLVVEPEMDFSPVPMDYLYLLVLAILCTTLAYVLALRALRHISAFASNLTINLEPVYGILLAAFLFKEYEELNSGFYIGAGLILMAVFAYPIISRVQNLEEEE